VFLQAGSFVSKIDLGQDKLIDTNNPVCFKLSRFLVMSLVLTNGQELILAEQQHLPKQVLL
jgi:hypothetical protein